MQTSVEVGSMPEKKKEKKEKKTRSGLARKLLGS
jgi:hypothetical protein